jgi:hypothetical protein
MMALFSELFVPWLLERLKDVADSERAQEGGKSGGVILFLASVLLAALLGLALVKVYDLQGEKIEAAVRLETTKEKLADLNKDIDDLEKEVEKLRATNGYLESALDTPVVCPSGPSTRTYKRNKP